MANDENADAPAFPQPPPHHLERLPRVLSIQSHVASGRVGNRAALFPLALHRFDCDAVNTVSLSNHTGYPCVAGSRLSAEGLEELLAGLEENGFLGASEGRRGYDYVLTGYVGRADTLSGIKAAIESMVLGGGVGGDRSEKKTKKRRQRPLIVVDPVMGDHDRARALSSSSLSSSLYVPEDVPAVYRSLLPLADVITPNAFEAEMLLLAEGEGEEDGRGSDDNGRDDGDNGDEKIERRRRFEIVDEASAIAACAALHSRGPGIVVLTSVVFPASRGSSAPSKTLTLYASQCRREESDSDGDGEESGSSPRRRRRRRRRRFPSPPAGATPANPAVWKLELPRIDAPFTGTGDLLTALLLSFLHKAGGGGNGEGKGTKGGGGGGGGGGGEGGAEEESRDLGWALDRAAAGVRAVVDATVAGAAAEAARAAAEAGGKEEGEEEDEDEEEEEERSIKEKEKDEKPPLSSDYWASARAVAARELRLVQCADALVAPRVVARAERIR